MITLWQRWRGPLGGDGASAGRELERQSAKRTGKQRGLAKSRAINGSEDVVIAAIASGAPVAINAIITVRGV